MGLSKHDKIAKNLAKEYRTEYNKGKDRTSRQEIE